MENNCSTLYSEKNDIGSDNFCTEPLNLPSQATDISFSSTLHSDEKMNLPSFNEPPNSKRELFVPDNFRNIIGDFVNDLSSTFPEYSFLWVKWSFSNVLGEQEIIELFEYALKVFPERFFDILYQNDEIFNIESEINTMFLPNVDFKIIFNCNGISENTKKVIWKYLQLILFSILNSINDKSRFGETINIFEGLDESILQEKLEETIKGMSNFFTNVNNKNENQNETDTENANETDTENANETDNINEGTSKENMSFDFENNLPNPEELHEHLKTLFDGKIGKLAKELAEEITEDINQFIDKDDLENVKTSQDVIKTLLKNPKKMMDLVKSVGKKLNTKMESGEISQDEIMKEASDLFSKMKDMKGTKQFNEMFNNMAKQMGMNGNGMKPNTNAMEQKMKNIQLKEKLKKRLQTKREISSSTTVQEESPLNFTNGLFSLNKEEEPINPLQDIDSIIKTLGLSNLIDTLPSNSNKKTKNKNKKR
jgi:hypothetical protein